MKEQRDLKDLIIHDVQPICDIAAASSPPHPCSLEKPPDLDLFFDDLARAKSTKKLK